WKYSSPPSLKAAATSVASISWMPSKVKQEKSSAPKDAVQSFFAKKMQKTGEMRKIYAFLLRFGGVLCKMIY
ncbi:MAG: hypothetical protein IKD01_03120, partial [Oscillospiraceae bacterium]|nr:hypothetical protein [Oscillospiraceae bacterium]